MLVELRVGEQRYRAVWEAGYGRERSLEDTPPSSPREDGSPFCGRCWIRTNLAGFWLGAILRKLNRPGFVGGCVVYATSRSGVAVLACRW